MPIQSLFELTNWNAKLEDIPGKTTPNDKVLPKGIITELKCPVIEREMDTAKRAGELGVVARPKYFNEVEVGFTVRGVFKEFLEGIALGIANSITLTATCCLQPDSGTPKAYIVKSKGFVSSLPFGGLSNDGIESEIKLMAWYVEITLDTLSVIYDPRNYILSVNGVNLFADIKTILDPP